MTLQQAQPSRPFPFWVGSGHQTIQDPQIWPCEHACHALSELPEVHKSQSCKTWVAQSQCRCVKILSQVYAFLADYSILQFLTLRSIILPRSPYYSFDICHYSHGDVHKHILYIGYNNDSMSFSLVEDNNKIPWLCPSVASLGLLSNSDQEVGTMEVDSLLVLTALLIATDCVCSSDFLFDAC